MVAGRPMDAPDLFGAIKHSLPGGCPLAFAFSLAVSWIIIHSVHRTGERPGWRVHGVCVCDAQCRSGVWIKLICLVADVFVAISFVPILGPRGALVANCAAQIWRRRSAAGLFFAGRPRTLP